MTKRKVVVRKKKKETFDLSDMFLDRPESVSIERYPQTDNELWWWVFATWGVKIPRQRVCPNHVAPFDAFSDAFFARAPVMVWKACIPSWSMVYTESGPVRMDEVKVGQEVWSWDEGKIRLSAVTDKWRVGVEKTLVLNTRAGEVTCTPNHRILVAKENGWRSYGKPRWLRADRIKPGDFIIRPNGWAGDEKVDTDPYELAGIILSDGHVSEYKFLIAHHKDAGYMDHYYTVVERLFGKQMRKDPQNRCSWLHSKLAASWAIEKGLSGTAHTKRVPQWVWDAPREGKVAFLRGFLDGDGTVREDGCEFFSCNEMLMQDIRHIAMSVGLRVGRVSHAKMSGQVTINGRVVNRGDMYSVRVYDLAIIGSNDPKYYFKNTVPQKSLVSGDEYIGHRVLSVEEGGEQEVWDLTVDGTESFIADGYVVHNSRGYGGKTQLISLLGMSELVALGAFVTILGGSGAQSLRVHETMSEAWHYDGAPKNLLLKDPTKFDTYLTNGGKARTLMASTKSVRGPHPQRMRLDEIDEMEMKVLTSAQGQPMRKQNKRGEIIETNTVLSSTHQYADGTMSEIIKRAKKEGWPIYEWCMVAGTLVDTCNGLVPIEQVKAGDKVVAWNGEKYVWSEVEGAGYTGCKKTVEVITRSGRKIRCTPDHKVQTTEGWEEAGSLVRGSLVVCGVPEMSNESGSVASQLESSEERFVQSVLAQGSKKKSAVPVREQENCTSEKVQDLFSKEHGKKEYQGCGIPSQAESRSQESTDGIKIGSIYSGNLAGTGNTIRGTSSYRDICGGFPVGANSDRVSGVASRSGREQNTFCEKENLVGGTGLRSNRTMVVSAAPLVYATDEVVSVEEREEADVFDITVAEHHNFVANGILVHNCWQESSNPIDGWLSLDEVERKRKEIPKFMWESEYDLQEPSHDERAFDTDAIERAFDLSLGYAECQVGKYIEIEPPSYDCDYITGVDWAKSKDFTVIKTYDVTNPNQWKTVAFERIQRRPWPQMVDRLNIRWKRYGGKVAHDATGIGSVVSDYIEYPKGARQSDLQPIIMAGKKRNDLITEYTSAVERDMFKGPRLQWDYEQHKFCTPDDLYNGTSTSHLPDSVAASALAFHIRNKHSRVSVPVDISMTRETSPWKMGSV